MKKEIAQAIEQLLEEECAPTLIHEGIIKARKQWSNKTDRVYATRAVIEEKLGKPLEEATMQEIKQAIQETTHNDFINNGLRGLLAAYDHSPYKALKEAFPSINMQPWEMQTTPKGFSKKSRGNGQA